MYIFSLCASYCFANYLIILLQESFFPKYIFQPKAITDDDPMTLLLLLLLNES